MTGMSWPGTRTDPSGTGTKGVGECACDDRGGMREEGLYGGSAEDGDEIYAWMGKHLM